MLLLRSSSQQNHSWFWGENRSTIWLSFLAMFALSISISCCPSRILSIARWILVGWLLGLFQLSSLAVGTIATTVGTIATTVGTVARLGLQQLELTIGTEALFVGCCVFSQSFFKSKKIQAWRSVITYSRSFSSQSTGITHRRQSSVVRVHFESRSTGCTYTLFFRERSSAKRMPTQRPLLLYHNIIFQQLFQQK